jgi:hypothetical protein
MDTLTIIPPDHECDTRYEGEWIIWTCPRCPQYCRQYNPTTGEMRVYGADMFIRHGAKPKEDG